jgi:hypothetical protein
MKNETDGLRCAYAGTQHVCSDLEHLKSASVRRYMSRQEYHVKLMVLRLALLPRNMHTAV